MSPVGMLHVGAALIALLTGGVILAVPQGTDLHRRLGYAFFGCLALLNGASVFMHQFNGGFGPFHVFTIISSGTTLMAAVPILTRRPGWLLRHYYWACWSYVGLVAALIAEVGVRLPGFRSNLALFITAIAGGSMAATLAGGFLIGRNARRLMGRVAARKRPRAYRGEDRMLA